MPFSLRLLLQIHPPYNAQSKPPRPQLHFLIPSESSAKQRPLHHHPVDNQCLGLPLSWLRPFHTGNWILWRALNSWKHFRFHNLSPAFGPLLPEFQSIFLCNCKVAGRRGRHGMTTHGIFIHLELKKFLQVNKTPNKSRLGNFVSGRTVIMWFKPSRCLPGKEPGCCPTPLPH